MSKCSTKVSEEKWKDTVRLFTCRGCINHLKDYVFKFGKREIFSWNYTRLLKCDIENVIYILIRRTCWMLYIDETRTLRLRNRKHSSSVLHPTNTYCKELTAHLRNRSKIKRPYFHMHPVFYVADSERRVFVKKRYTVKFRLLLNGNY